MSAFIVRRVLQMMAVLLVLSFVLVALLRAMPGDPVDQLMMSRPGIKKADIDRLRKFYGIDDPLPVFYAKQMRSFLKGDLGTSRSMHRPVTEILSERIGNTLRLTLTALLVSLAVALPVGVYAALRQYSAFDYMAGGLAFVGISIPSFWLGIMLIQLFATSLGWFPISGMNSSADAGFVDALRHLVLPVATLATLSIGAWTRYVRSSFLEVIKQDYVRTARAKGLDEDTVVWKHAFRNALIPFVTILGLSIPALFSGALITETIFSWPGMGRLLYDSVVARDYNVAVVSFMFLAFLTLLCNLLADLAYALVDPRIRVG